MSMAGLFKILAYHSIKADKCKAQGRDFLRARVMSIRAKIAFSDSAEKLWLLLAVLLLNSCLHPIRVFGWLEALVFIAQTLGHDTIVEGL